MSIYDRFARAGERVLPADVLMRYVTLEECILSGQMSDAEVQGLLREDAEFARWFKARVPNRLRGCVSPTL